MNLLGIWILFMIRVELEETNVRFDQCESFSIAFKDEYLIFHCHHNSILSSSLKMSKMRNDFIWNGNEKTLQLQQHSRESCNVNFDFFFFSQTVIATINKSKKKINRKQKVKGNLMKDNWILSALNEMRFSKEKKNILLSFFAPSKTFLPPKKGGKKTFLFLQSSAIKSDGTAWSPAEISGNIKWR